MTNDSQAPRVGASALLPNRSGPFHASPMLPVPNPWPLPQGTPVTVTGGPHAGQIGTVFSYYPGGWLQRGQPEFCITAEPTPWRFQSIYVPAAYVERRVVLCDPADLTCPICHSGQVYGPADAEGVRDLHYVFRTGDRVLILYGHHAGEVGKVSYTADAYLGRNGWTRGYAYGVSPEGQGPTRLRWDWVAPTH